MKITFHGTRLNSIVHPLYMSRGKTAGQYLRRKLPTLSTNKSNGRNVILHSRFEGVKSQALTYGELSRALTYRKGKMEKMKVLETYDSFTLPVRLMMIPRSSSSTEIKKSSSDHDGIHVRNFRGSCKPFIRGTLRQRITSLLDTTLHIRPFLSLISLL